MGGVSTFYSSWLRVLFSGNFGRSTAKEYILGDVLRGSLTHTGKWVWGPSDDSLGRYPILPETPETFYNFFCPQRVSIILLVLPGESPRLSSVFGHKKVIYEP